MEVESGEEGLFACEPKQVGRGGPGESSIEGRGDSWIPFFGFFFCFHQGKLNWLKMGTNREVFRQKTSN